MQCGFALLEAGAVRAKNVTNVLLKNFLDARELLFDFDVSLFEEGIKFYYFEFQSWVW